MAVLWAQESRGYDFWAAHFHNEETTSGHQRSSFSGKNTGALVACMSPRTLLAGEALAAGRLVAGGLAWRAGADYSRGGKRQLVMAPSKSPAPLSNQRHNGKKKLFLF